MSSLFSYFQVVKKTILDERPMVSLFTRPRRFGKTLNMDMLRTFFEKTIPLIMNEINRKKESENKRFESNKDLYVELSNLLIQIQVENEVKEDNKENFQNLFAKKAGMARSLCIPL